MATTAVGHARVRRARPERPSHGRSGLSASAETWGLLLGTTVPALFVAHVLTWSELLRTIELALKWVVGLSRRVRTVGAHRSCAALWRPNFIEMSGRSGPADLLDARRAVRSRRTHSGHRRQRERPEHRLRDRDHRGRRAPRRPRQRHRACRSHGSSWPLHVSPRRTRRHGPCRLRRRRRRRRHRAPDAPHHDSRRSHRLYALVFSTAAAAIIAVVLLWDGSPTSSAAATV